MYRGFNVDISFESEPDYELGLTSFTRDEEKVKKELNAFLAPDGSINGEALIAEWFPQIDADIFISHSHKDKRMAITLAGWLQKNFGINAFVDSCIWGYADTLLWQIDKKYCYDEVSKIFNYEERNRSTSHVHMMLSVALTKMMDSTECLFFLNTPSSITPSDAIEKRTTNSPWLYAEIAMSQMIGKPLLRHRRFELMIKSNLYSDTRSLTESLKVHYPIPLKHLTKITGTHLTHWMKEYLKDDEHEKHPLDYLYDAH